MSSRTSWWAPLLGVLLVAIVPHVRAENVDPNEDGSQYAWGENVGWINAEPSGDGGPGMQVDDFELTGWLWGEGAGWISLSCVNTSSCGSVDYRVRNDGTGSLSGLAFAENLGWVNFAPLGGGVSVDPSTGEFQGHAWSENAGWISFRSTQPGPVFSLVTSWSCDPPPAPPSGNPSLFLTKGGNDVLFQWSAVSGATGFDLVAGDLDTLRSSAGDFALATAGCLTDNDADGQHVAVEALLDQTNAWYALRPVNCGGAGSYDSGGAMQAAPRDAGITGSGLACP